MMGLPTFGGGLHGGLDPAQEAPVWAIPGQCFGLDVSNVIDGAMGEPPQGTQDLIEDVVQDALEAIAVGAVGFVNPGMGASLQGHMYAYEKATGNRLSTDIASLALDIVAPAPMPSGNVTVVTTRGGQMTNPNDPVAAEGPCGQSVVAGLLGCLQPRAYGDDDGDFGNGTVCGLPDGPAPADLPGGFSAVSCGCLADDGEVCAVAAIEDGEFPSAPSSTLGGGSFGANAACVDDAIDACPVECQVSLISAYGYATEMPPETDLDCGACTLVAEDDGALLGVCDDPGSLPPGLLEFCATVNPFGQGGALP